MIPCSVLRTLKIALISLMVILPYAQCLAEEDAITVEINKGQMVKLKRPAASLIVADPTTADVQAISPKLIFVRGKKVGETSLSAIDEHDNPILETTINVTHNISSLARTIKRVAPNADVGFTTLDGGLVMDGFAGSVAESENIRSVAAAYLGADEKMVNMIKTAGSDQVMLKVKIVEMSHNDLKKLGLNLQNALSIGDLRLQILQGPDIGLATSGKFASGSFTDSTTLLDRQGSQDTQLLLRSPGNKITSVVDALETQGLANVLAEPTLTTTTGKAASFLAGGQFPLPVKDQNGAITIQYKPFGVSLNFTPVVMNKERISVTVAPEVSTLDFNNPIQVAGITYPILNTRQASSVVELGSGDSFALAGLLENQTTTNINKFPGLGDVPVLGALFRSTQFQNNQTELVILVTPYIVHPVAEAKLQTPLDGYAPPSDLQLLMLGNLYQQEGMDKEDKTAAPLPKLHGEGGFIME